MLQTRHSVTITVPGRTYKMEFEVGYQTESKCQGELVLLYGSIQKGVVQHREFIITVEEVIFHKQGDKVWKCCS